MATSIQNNSITTFRQAWAPVKWTKETSLNDYALRVTSTLISDSNTTGVNFSTAFNQQLMFGGTLNVSATIGATAGTLTSHSHNVVSAGAVLTSSTKPLFYSPQNPTQFITSFSQTNTLSGSTGTGTAHTHTFTATTKTVTVPMPNISIKYIDIILAKRTG
jgi:hypothetical protein